MNDSGDLGTTLHDSLHEVIAARERIHVGDEHHHDLVKVLGGANQDMTDNAITFIFNIGFNPHGFHEVFDLVENLLCPLVFNKAFLDGDQDMGSRFVEATIDIATTILA